MEITVNVDKVDLRTVISGRYGDSSETLGEEIASQLVQRIAKTEDYRGIAGRVKEIRDEEIRALVAPAVADAFNQPIKRTNSYGEQTGTSSTLRELVIEEARTYLNQPADSYDRKRGTRLERAVREAVDAAFKAELAEAVKTAREAIATQMGTTVADLVADAVREAMKARV